MRRIPVVLLVICCGSCGGGAGDGCRADGECPVHQLCEGGGCRTGCIGDGECGPAQRCGPHGRCLDAVASNDDLAATDDLSLGADLTASPDLTAPDFSDASAQNPDLTPACGDGRLDPGEDCDDGAANSDNPAAAASCTRVCRRRASCGALASSDGARINPASGHCYVAWPGAVTWAAAQRQCQAQGGALASGGPPEEEALLRSLAGAVPRWLALGASNSDGDCPRLEGGAVTDVPCGWPTSGLLPASATSTAGFLCESGCGNGVVEAGEGCDPPGPACTNTCQAVRGCPEGMTSPVSGHCYFVAGPNSDYTAALSACPAGTHLATLETPAETEVALKLVGGDTWVALRAPATVGAFAWDAASGEPFVAARYHGFITGEPNHNASPTCMRLVTTGWRDQICTSSYPHLCERE